MVYSRQNGLELLGIALRESLRAIRDPYLRGDSVALVGEATGEYALRALRQKLVSDAEGRRLLRERPLFLNGTSASALNALPAHTLGGAFGRYMSMHGFELGERPKVTLIEDEELAFVMQRYRDTHDILHAVCGAPISVAGEVALKWFEASQTELPMTGLAAVFGILRSESTQLSSPFQSILFSAAQPLSHVLPSPASTLLNTVISASQQGPPVQDLEQRRVEEAILNGYIHWCTRAARKSKLFLSIVFEDHLEEDLRVFRRRMNLPSLPMHLPSLDACWDASRRDCLREHYKAALKALENDSNPERKAPFLTYLDNLENLEE